MTKRPHTTVKRRRGRHVDDHRLQPIDDWATDLLATARRQHDATRTEEIEEPS